MAETLTGNAEHPPLYEPITLNNTAQSDTEEAMARYQRFIEELPIEQRRRFHVVDQTRQRTSEAGYVYKEKIDPDSLEAKDRKHVFHFTPELGRHIDAMNRREIPQAAHELRQIAEAIFYDVASTVKSRFTDWAGDQNSWLVGAHFPSDGKLGHHLRFLAYELGENGLLAEGHYDKSTATVAIAENKGGLRIGLGPQDLQLVDRANFDPIIFPGYGWHQLHEMLDARTNRKAAWHDVVNTNGEADDEVLRMAMVYFVNPAKLYLDSSDEQTHTPIPWRNVDRVAMRKDSRSFLLE